MFSFQFSVGGKDWARIDGLAAGAVFNDADTVCVTSAGIADASDAGNCSVKSADVGDILLGEAHQIDADNGEISGQSEILYPVPVRVILKRLPGSEVCVFCHNSGKV